MSEYPMIEAYASVDSDVKNGFRKRATVRALLLIAREIRALRETIEDRPIRTVPMSEETYYKHYND